VHEFAVLLAAFAAHGGLGFWGVCWLVVLEGAFDGLREGWWRWPVKKSGYFN
jgi:hypothetical protein